MKTIFHPADERGHADHGWLNAYHSFSFANWYDAKKVQFGLLRVLNDDTIAPAMGFGMHQHDNMEIVTIPLKGILEHKDSMGNTGQIKPGEIQAMSAGTGVFHSEYNGSKTEETKLFQVWIFPKVKDVEPRYEQKSFSAEERKNKFHTIVSPEKLDKTMWINQDAFFALGNFDKGKTSDYSIRHKRNGAYVMVVEGEIEIDGQKLSRRDAMGIWDTNKVSIKANSDSEILVIEVPMN
ncbi:MAG: pirin family protein [Bacteroidetes bacterium]|nr:pirin family protein [Bacteroidota bacterium]